MVYGAFLFMAIVALSGCKNAWMDSVLQKKVITFDSRGGSPVEPQILFRNETIRDPGSPLEPPQEHSATGKNWEFGYWGAIMDPENVESDNPDYINGSTFPDLLGIWNFDTIPDGDMTLYAVWTEY